MHHAYELYMQKSYNGPLGVFFNIRQLMACKAYFDLGEVFKCFICEDICLLTGKTPPRTILCQPHSPVIYNII